MLIGRARELEGTDALLAAARVGRGGLRVLSGEAGIGKTRLCDEVAARAEQRGFRVSWGRSWETAGAPAYFPWTEALTPLLHLAPEPSPRLKDFASPSLHTELRESARADAARERFELFEAVSAHLRSVSREAPCLLVFDDLHRADLASLELLSFVARGLRASRIAVLATWRDTEARSSSVSELLSHIAREGSSFVLRPLNHQEVGEVVRHELGQFDAALAADLYELTEGNPLFLHEMLHAVLASPVRLERQALASIALGGVRSLVRERLGGAAPALRQLLESAAAFGRQVSLSVLKDVLETSLDETEALLAEAARRGLLFRRGREDWVFAHVLVREAFYEELSAERRRELHERIARVLNERVDRGQEELLSPLAHHCLSALPLADAEHAIHAARRAAERARTQLAFEEAVVLLERALGACQIFGLGETLHAEALLALGWATTEAGDTARGRELFRRAAVLSRKLGDACLLARAALGQGGQYVLAEIREELVSVLRESLSSLENCESPDGAGLRARVLARLAAALTPSATPAEPLALARAALAMTGAESDPSIRIDVHLGVGAALADFALPGERIPINERLLRDARTVGDRVLALRALTRLSCDHLESGDLPSADAAILQRAELSDELGHPRYRWQTPLLRSMRAMPEGRFDECQAALEDARVLVAAANDPNAERCLQVHRFLLYWVAGRTRELRAAQAATLHALDILPDREILANWVSAIVAARSGEISRAAEALTALGPSSVMTARFSRIALADVMIATGAMDRCRVIYDSFAGDDESNACFGPFAFVCGPPVARTLSALAFALGDAEAGLRHGERAIRLCELAAARAHEAWSRLTLGEGSTDRSRAIEELRLAHSLGEELAMPEIMTRAQAALVRHGVTKERPSQAPGALVFSLTRDGEFWRVERAGLAHRLKDARGFGMLARLLASPDRELHVLDLAGDTETGSEAGNAFGDAGEVIDARAREAYKSRLRELHADLDEAERFSDIGRAERLRGELEALTQQLAAGTGLGGKARRAASAAERARITVQRRVREAIRKIGEHDAELGRHLDWTVRTGTYCAYEPQGRKASR